MKLDGIYVHIHIYMCVYVYDKYQSISGKKGLVGKDREIVIGHGMVYLKENVIMKLNNSKGNKSMCVNKMFVILSPFQNTNLY